MIALNVQNAKKTYKTVQALKGVNLEVSEGEFFGLLGPNGAGKSTLIKSIVGLCRLSKGSIRVFGKDVVDNYAEARKFVGYSPQEVNLDRFFPIRKVLQYHAGFFGYDKKFQKQETEKVLDQLSLLDKADQKYYKLSGGMQKRVLVAKALITKPKLLILDEPTAGVDVEQRHELWNILRALKASGTTIILTTHYIDEAEALCERIGVINHGEICEMGSPKGLIHKYCKTTVKIETNQRVEQILFQDVDGFTVSCEENLVIAKGDRAGEMTEKVLSQILKQQGLMVKDISVNTGTLEDVFLAVTGDHLEVA